MKKHSLLIGGIVLIVIGVILFSIGDTTPQINPQNGRPIMRGQDVAGSILSAIGVFLIFINFGWVIE